IGRMPLRRFVDLPTLDPWIDEGAQPDPAEIARASRRNRAIERRQLSLGQADRLRQTLSQERRHLWHQAPVRPDDPPDESFLGEVLETLSAVGLAGGMHDDEVTRMTQASKALLDTLVD